jgi:hypothetical protein
MPMTLLYFVVLFQGFSDRFAVFGLFEKTPFSAGLQGALTTRKSALGAISLGIEDINAEWLPRMDSNHE